VIWCKYINQLRAIPADLTWDLRALLVIELLPLM
jgi:hypothetical protein